MTQLAYAVMVEPLPEAEGGGFLASVPDLLGCMSGGATPEQALLAVYAAIEDWISEARRLGRSIPHPTKRVA